MTPTKLEGITKARLAENIIRARTGADLYPDDAAYVAHVCADVGLTELPERAADSYAAQFAAKTIAQLEYELAAEIAAKKAQDLDVPAPPAAEMTAEDIANVFKAEVVAAVQGKLDAFAAQRGYDGILSACTYVSSTAPTFADEAQTCVNLRDATWSACYQLMADVQAGKRAMPASVADVLAELPRLAWR